MRREKTASKRSDVTRLSHEQESELAGGWSVMGESAEGGGPVHFSSEELRREAWRLHGDRIMSDWNHSLARPRGWWLYEQGQTRPPSGSAQIIPLAIGQHLTEPEWREIAGLTASFRRDVIAAPGFSELPARRRAIPIAARGLFLGLTPIGVDHFLNQLPRQVRREVEVAHEEAIEALAD